VPVGDGDPRRRIRRCRRRTAGECHQPSLVAVRNGRALRGHGPARPALERDADRGDPDRTAWRRWSSDPSGVRLRAGDAVVCVARSRSARVCALVHRPLPCPDLVPGRSRESPATAEMPATVCSLSEAPPAAVARGPDRPAWRSEHEPQRDPVRRLSLNRCRDGSRAIGHFGHPSRIFRNAWSASRIGPPPT